MGNKQSSSYLQFQNNQPEEPTLKELSIKKLGNCLWEVTLPRDLFDSSSLPTMTLKVYFPQSMVTQKIFTLTGEDEVTEIGEHENQTINTRRFLVIAPPNCASFRLELSAETTCLSTRELTTKSYSAATKALLSEDGSVDAQRTKLIESLKNFPEKDYQFRFIPLSETGSGKSTLLNMTCKNLNSDLTNPFIVGNSSHLQNSNENWSVSEDEEDLRSYTNHLASIERINQSDFSRISLIDCPALFTRVMKERLENFFAHLKEKEEELKIDAIFVPIPMKDTQELVSQERNSVMSFYQYLVNMYNRQAQTPPVFCLSQIDHLYLFNQYIKKDSTIIDISQLEDKKEGSKPGTEANIPEVKEDPVNQSRIKRVKLLKLFYEWYVVENKSIMELLGIGDSHDFPTFFTHFVRNII